MHRDPLTPKILDFEISEEEMHAISYALTQKDSWNLVQDCMDKVREILKSLRLRIKEFHLARQKNLCCYCRTNLHGGGNFMIDREHIVPKSFCKELTYVITNLSVACKRCNMEIKKNKTDLFVHPESINQNHLDENAYRIIHPNFEIYEEFIVRVQAQVGTTQLVKFHKVKQSEKTNYMFNFFKLNDLEIQSFDAAQGLPSKPQTQSLLLEAIKYEMQSQPALVLHLLQLLTGISTNENNISLPIDIKQISHPTKDDTPPTPESDYDAFLKKFNIKGIFNESIARISPTLRLPLLKKHDNDKGDQ